MRIRLSVTLLNEGSLPINVGARLPFVTLRDRIQKITAAVTQDVDDTQHKCMANPRLQYSLNDLKSGRQETPASQWFSHQRWSMSSVPRVLQDALTRPPTIIDGP